MSHDQITLPRHVIEEAARAIGAFISDEGWCDADMQAMDNLDAALAAAEVQPAPAHPVNALQESTGRYTLKTSRVAFCEGASWAAQCLGGAPVAMTPLTDAQIDAIADARHAETEDDEVDEDMRVFGKSDLRAIVRAAMAAAEAQPVASLTVEQQHLLQDCDKGLTAALAGKPDAMRHAREAAVIVAQAQPVAVPQDVGHLQSMAHTYADFKKPSVWDRENLHDCIEKLAALAAAPAAPDPAQAPPTDAHGWSPCSTKCIGGNP